ncbi:DUF6886 family protein [Devosia nitrariae]|uniref:Uncharacterized protein n=1 Tax=Devosia nitrariae TaxID=2071872 RepID=A0ABQ5W0I2_9HYPH|nr:DUF6886 family protein [Devosia nitrariae]GLQ53430.1 hypothetical protein GCM10010862_06880 [Devosia nitrariae]
MSAVQPARSEPDRPISDLFHVSEEGDIDRFVPRPSDYTDHPVVWAIHKNRLCNYLLPRECPRVTFYAHESTAPTDIERFLGDDRIVVAVEQGWLDRIKATSLFVYTMPEAPFVLKDANAGYWVSSEPVTPLARDQLSDPHEAMAARGATLRILPSLWPLHDAIAASSLKFSMIRMRSASARLI